MEPALLRLLQLIADVSRLSGVPLIVPENVTTDLINDLLTARRLLRGEETSGTWHEGEVRFELGQLDFLRETFSRDLGHDLRATSDKQLDFLGTVVPLGTVEQYYSAAHLASLDVDGQEVVLRLAAPPGGAPSTMRPLRTVSDEIALPQALSQAAFEQLVTDLESPRRFSTLNRLL